MTVSAPEPEPITRWAAGTTEGAIWLNGTGVMVDDQGILILGASGTGKSSLALHLLALGAELVADDGLWLDGADDPPRITRPAQSPDLIEARGIGLIRAGTTRASAPLAIVVDLDRAEPERLPPRRLVAIGETTRPLILGAGHNTLAPALVLMARHGCAKV
jgi:HPr kinase/phosphorylase